MNKILSTLAIAGLAGSPLAFAELEGFSIKGKVDFESEYIFRGKEHSDKNLQTKVVGEYALPISGANTSVYAGVFMMSPIDQAANELDSFFGAKTEWEKYLFEVGYTHYSYPNHVFTGESAPGIGGLQNPSTNKPVYSDSNELSFGVATSQWKEYFTPSLYFHYNIDLGQLTTEVAARKAFKGDEYGIAGAELILSAFIGYVDADAYNGDQRGDANNTVAKWTNGYAYLGGSVDVAYNVTNSAKIGTGVRYAHNNDGQTKDDPRLAGNTQDNIWYGVWAEFRY